MRNNGDPLVAKYCSEHKPRTMHRRWQSSTNTLKSIAELGHGLSPTLTPALCPKRVNQWLSTVAGAHVYLRLIRG